MRERERERERERLGASRVCHLNARCVARRWYAAMQSGVSKDHFVGKRGHPGRRRWQASSSSSPSSLYSLSCLSSLSSLSLCPSKTLKISTRCARERLGHTRAHPTVYLRTASLQILLFIARVYKNEREEGKIRRSRRSAEFFSKFYSAQTRLRSSVRASIIELWIAAGLSLLSVSGEYSPATTLWAAELCARGEKLN